MDGGASGGEAAGRWSGGGAGEEAMLLGIGADWEPSERTSVSSLEGAEQHGSDPEPAVVYVCHQNFFRMLTADDLLEVSHPTPPADRKATWRRPRLAAIFLFLMALFCRLGGF